MDRDEQQNSESPIARLERALSGGKWRGTLRRAGVGGPSSGYLARRRRKRILAVALAVLLVGLLATLVVGPRLLNRGELNVLVLGLDDSAGHLADTILFVHADLAAGTVGVLSVPRDTWIVGADGRGHKANSLLRQSDGLGRLARALHVVAPSHRITLKTDFMPSLVDAVGGVEVEVGPVPLNSFDKAGKWHIHVPAGKQHLEGKQAFGFARFRKPRPGPCPFCGATWKTVRGAEATDLARIGRQQVLLQAVLAKLRGSGGLWHGPRVLWAARAANNNLTCGERLALGNCLRRARQPEFAMYPTRISGKRLLPVPEASSRLGGAVSGILAGRVIVRNGAGSPGLAGRVATQLAREGYLVARPENAPRAAHTTIEGPEESSRQVQKALGYGSCVYRDSKDTIVTIGLDAPNPE